MRKIFPSGIFNRDLKRIVRHNRDVAVLYEMIECLRLGKNVPLASKLHKLHGEYEGCWECHIEFDLLLIWKYDDDDIILVRTGTHADLFE